jgi:hypothetical protein
MRHLVQRWADDRSRARPRSRWPTSSADSPLIRVSATQCWVAPVVTLGERLGGATVRGIVANTEYLCYPRCL